MAFAPIICTGNLEVNGDDVSDQVTAFLFAAVRSDIPIPATFGSRMSHAPGDDTYTVQIDYLPDTDTTALTQVFWEAIADAAGTVTVAGTLRPGAVSATNPQFTGVALVTGVGIGGTVNTVAVDSQTFPLLDRPTQVVTP